MGMKADNARRPLQPISLRKFFNPLLNPFSLPPLRPDDVTRSFMIFARLSPSDVCVLLCLFSGRPGAGPTTHPFASPLPSSLNVVVLHAPLSRFCDSLMTSSGFSMKLVLSMQPPSAQCYTKLRLVLKGCIQVKSMAGARYTAFSVGTDTWGNGLIALVFFLSGCCGA